MQLDTVTLPDDLLWINEFSWNPIGQSIDRSLSGALLVQEQGATYGRPIELSGGEESGWVARSVVEQLLAMSLIPNKIMTLTLADTRQFSVIFDRGNGSPITANQVLPYAYPGDDYQYSLSIRLVTVKE